MGSEQPSSTSASASAYASASASASATMVDLERAVRLFEVGVEGLSASGGWTTGRGGVTSARPLTTTTTVPATTTDRRIGYPNPNPNPNPDPNHVCRAVEVEVVYPVGQDKGVFVLRGDGTVLFTAWTVDEEGAGVWGSIGSIGSIGFGSAYFSSLVYILDT